MAQSASPVVGALVGVALLVPFAFAGGASPEAQRQSGARLSTDHVEVAYPDGAEAGAKAFLAYAEEVYAYVDSLFGGVLAPRVAVQLVKTGLADSMPEAITLSLEHGRYMEPMFARGLAHAAGQAIVGPLYDAEGYRFFREGLAAWVSERYERRLGAEEPRWLWGAYAYMQEGTYLEYLEVYDRASEELNREVVDAVGYTFVANVVERDGWAGVMKLLHAMPDNVEVCSALNDAGLDCEATWRSWQAALEVEAGRHDFTRVPQVYADLQVSGEGELRDLSLRVSVRNPETSSYLYFVSYEIEGERVEESYPADRNDIEALVRLGTVPVGTKVLWEVAVWSRSVRTWRKSGWQDRIIR